VALISDEPDPPEIVQLCLMGEHTGFALRRLREAEVRLLASCAERAVLLDIGNGAPHALGTLQVCRALRPDLPVVVLTGGTVRSRFLMRAGAFFAVPRDPAHSATLRRMLLRACSEAQVARGVEQHEAELFAAAFASSADAMLDVTEDGRILSWNPAAGQLLGHQRTDMVGRPLDALAAPGQLHGEFLRCAVRDGSVASVERVWLHRDGLRIPMSLSFSAIRSSHDAPLTILVVGRDLRAAKKGEELERLAAIGQLAAGVAHEINNPCAFVHGNLTVLADELVALGTGAPGETAPAPGGAPEGTGPETQARLDAMREMVEECLLGVQRIRTIVRDLGMFARIDNADVALVSPNDLVHDALALARNQIRHRARLSIRLGDLPPLALDRAKMAQVVLNLLVNAADALGENPAERNQILVESSVRGEQILLAVEDNGCGIPPEHLAHLFTPFYTTKPHGKGSGLGLTISAETVRKHGGELHVSSEVGRGTRFEIWLPRTTLLHRSLPAPAAAPQPVAAAGPTTRRLRILVIDDEPLVRRSLRRMLARHHDVIEAESGASALVLLDRDASFDAVFCDLMMPETDGVAVWEQLSVQHRALAGRMIFVTGGAVTQRARRFIDSAQPRLLEKPVARGELLAALDQLLGPLAAPG
jgi:PAS domain S-box-containing protein